MSSRLRPRLDDDESAYMIDEPHGKIHEGKAFYVTNLFGALADNADAEMIVITGANKRLHLTFESSAPGDHEKYIYEGSITTAPNGNGTTTPILNSDFGSSITSDATAFYTPTVDSDEDAKGSWQVPGGIGTFSGISDARRIEKILQASTNYLFRVTNRSGSAGTFSMDLSWYEEDV